MLHGSNPYNFAIFCTTFWDTGWLLPSINFECLCFEDLPGMLKRWTTAQIKDKDLNLNSETSPAWIWSCTAVWHTGWLLPSINFECFCFDYLPDVLERCTKAQIKYKDLKLNLETSSAWFWPLQPCILLRRFFWLLPSINFEFFWGASRYARKV